MSIWNNPEFQESIRQALIWAAETTEADAVCLAESLSIQGDNAETEDKMLCDFLEKKAAEMNELLDLMVDTRRKIRV